MLSCPPCHAGTHKLHHIRHPLLFETSIYSFNLCRTNTRTQNTSTYLQPPFTIYSPTAATLTGRRLISHFSGSAAWSGVFSD